MGGRFFNGDELIGRDSLGSLYGIWIMLGEGDVDGSWRDLMVGR